MFERRAFILKTAVVLCVYYIVRRAVCTCKLVNLHIRIPSSA